MQDYDDDAGSVGATNDTRWPDALEEFRYIHAEWNDYPDEDECTELTHPALRCMCDYCDSKREWVM